MTGIQAEDMDLSSSATEGDSPIFAAKTALLPGDAGGAARIGTVPLNGSLDLTALPGTRYNRVALVGKVPAEKGHICGPAKAASTLSKRTMP